MYLLSSPRWGVLRPLCSAHYRDDTLGVADPRGGVCIWSIVPGRWEKAYVDQRMLGRVGSSPVEETYFPAAGGRCW